MKPVNPFASALASIAAQYMLTPTQHLADAIDDILIALEGTELNDWQQKKLLALSEFMCNFSIMPGSTQSDYNYSRAIRPTNGKIKLNARIRRKKYCVSWVHRVLVAKILDKE